MPTRKGIIWAILIGAFAALMVFVLTKNLTIVVSRQAPTKPSPPVIKKVRILVAQKDISSYTLIPEEALIPRILPSNEVPKGAVTTMGAVVGKMPREKIFAGEPILSSNLTSPEERGLSYLLSPGQRAVSIKVEENWRSLVNLIKVGDYVDVLATFDNDFTRTILQNIRVVALDGKIKEGETAKVEKINTVTLGLGPEQVEIFTLTRKRGTIQLALRSSFQKGKETTFASSGVRADKLRLEKAPPSPPKTEIYEWVDDKGTLNFTNIYQSIPDRYKKRAKKYSGEE